MHFDDNHKCINKEQNLIQTLTEIHYVKIWMINEANTNLMQYWSWYGKNN